MALEAGPVTVQAADVLPRLDRLAADVSAMRQELSRLTAARSASAQTTKWVRKVNATINDPTLSQEEREKVVDSVPRPLRHAVAAECYRTNENVTFGWAAAIAGVLTFEVPDLLWAYGVEPDETPLTPEEMDEQVALIRQHHDTTRQVSVQGVSLRGAERRSNPLFRDN